MMEDREENVPEWRSGGVARSVPEDRIAASPPLSSIIPPSDPKERFSNRVEAYVRYRPSYPDEVVWFLERIGLATPGMNVADIGSGTGISAQLFLRNGYDVIGVEPNAAMRTAAERLLAGVTTGANAAPGTFRSVNGSAEATTLPDASVDLVIAGQAFHWFDRAAAKRESLRILRPHQPGGIALFWNSRDLTSSPFAREYEALLKEYATDYGKVRHDELSAAEITGFLAPAAVETAVFPYQQHFDYAGLEGRLLSSSYAPAPGAPGHDAMIAALRQLFDRCQSGGFVVMEYRTEVYASH